MPFTTYTVNKFLEASHGKTTYTAPANVYVGLLTSTPTLAGGNVVEPTGNGYARVPVPGSSFSAASNGSITNTVEIVFNTATGAWGTIPTIGVFDAASGGNLLWFGSMPPQTFGLNSHPRIAVGAATSTLTGA